MKKILLLFTIILITIFIVSLTIYLINKYLIPDNFEVSNLSSYTINETSNFQNTINNVKSQTVILSDSKNSSFNITAIGDIMCHNTQFKDAYSNGFYDFSYVFTDIKEIIENADIAIGNLETTFAGREKEYSGYPAFNTPEALANNLKSLGIDVITTANNHSLDTGYSGLESTINYLDSAGLSHTGTFISEESQNTILYKEVNDIKIAFLTYTYGTNEIAIPKNKNFCVNLINKDLILHQLELAKQNNPDIICVSMHWGTEYESIQNEAQEELANFLFENGVDIILGSHPHVLQPMEKRNITLEDGTEKEVFVVYSLGNFMSSQTKQNTRTSIILNLQITKNNYTNKISIDDISYTPIYTYTYPNYKNYKIINLEKAVSDYENYEEKNISNETYTLFKTELDKVNNLYQK